MEKFLVVGLGNVGDKYANTRHNIGFKILNEISKFHLAVFNMKRLGFVAQFFFENNKIFLLKPSTSMNFSGKAVNFWMEKEKISIEKILVITDDLHLDFGVLRLKYKYRSSSGGHNGLKNIQNILNTSNYACLRFGIGNKFTKGGQIDYVLGKWTDIEIIKLPLYLRRTKEVIFSFILNGKNKTINSCNSWKI